MIIIIIVMSEVTTRPKMRLSGEDTGRWLAVENLLVRRCLWSWPLNPWPWKSYQFMLTWYWVIVTSSIIKMPLCIPKKMLLILLIWADVVSLWHWPLTFVLHNLFNSSLSPTEPKFRKRFVIQSICKISCSQTFRIWSRTDTRAARKRNAFSR